MFSLLIFGHELGHFVTARMFGVTVYEFAIGMGPKLFSKTSKKSGITYSIRWIPIGGYVSMAGEDAECDDENALNKKAVWKRMIILAAGGVMNLLMGLIIMFSYVCASPAIGSTTIAKFQDDAVSCHVLRQGDRIISVGKTKTDISSELLYEIMWNAGESETLTVKDENGESVEIENVTFLEMEVIRDGERMTLSVPFKIQNYEGVNFGTADFVVYREDKTVSSVLRHTLAETGLAATQVWESLLGLLTGRFGIQHLSGPVGVTEAVGQSIKVGIEQFLYIMGLISVNLGIVNLIPFPALDGGRLFFQFIELVFRKPINRELEAKIHTVGILMLLALMVIITFKDVIRLF